MIGYQSQRIELFEVATGHRAGRGMEHKNTVFGAAFSPDSRMLITCATDGTARLWTVPAGEPIRRPLELHRTIQQVAFTLDGRSIATQDSDLVRIWSLPDEGLPTLRVTVDGRRSFAALSPDGALAVPSGLSFANSRSLRSTRAFTITTGRPAGPVLRPGGVIIDASFSPDGSSVVTVSAPTANRRQGKSSWSGTG